MGVTTLLRFLIGDREAILTIASSRHALWVGLVFVLSAGFAREYDGEDLLREPWHLLLPLAVSLPAALVLLALVQLAGTDYGSPGSPSEWAKWLSFLGVFWMTAPLAWLYAVPYERFFDAATAVELNMATLIVVAVWRVALIIRVIQVCTRLWLLNIVGIVGLYATGAVFVACLVWLFAKLSVMDVMGGIHYAEEPKSVLADWLGRAGLLLLPAAIVWLILAVGFARRGVGWTPERIAGGRPSRVLVGLAAASLLLWAAVLPRTQAEQRLAGRVERVMQEDPATAVALLTAHPREAFPPHWAPPPLSMMRHFGGNIDRLRDHHLDVLEECLRQDSPDWVVGLYTRRLCKSVMGYVDLTSDQLERGAKVFPLVPDGREALERAREEDDHIYRRSSKEAPFSNLRHLRERMDGKPPRPDHLRAPLE